VQKKLIWEWHPRKVEPIQASDKKDEWKGLSFMMGEEASQWLE